MLDYIGNISFFVGLIGILVIVIGALIGIYRYFHPKYQIHEIRFVLGNHIILGLDFLVGKDIIDTLLLDGTNDPNKFWMDLAGLFTVVIIRIILTYFTEKELRGIEKQNRKKKS